MHGTRKYERYRQLAQRRAGSSAAAAPDIVHGEEEEDAFRAEAAYEILGITAPRSRRTRKDPNVPAALWRNVWLLNGPGIRRYKDGWIFFCDRHDSD